MKNENLFAGRSIRKRYRRNYTSSNGRQTSTSWSQKRSFCFWATRWINITHRGTEGTRFRSSARIVNKLRKGLCAASADWKSKIKNSLLRLQCVSTFVTFYLFASSSPQTINWATGNCRLYCRFCILFDLQLPGSPHNRLRWHRVTVVEAFRCPRRFSIFYFPNTTICWHGRKRPAEPEKESTIF